MKKILYKYLTTDMTDGELKSEWEKNGGKKMNWGCGSCKKKVFKDLWKVSNMDKLDIQNILTNHSEYIQKIHKLKSLKLQKYVVAVCVAKAYLRENKSLILTTSVRDLQKYLDEIEVVWKI